jgi:hypothetical protein
MASSKKSDAIEAIAVLREQILPGDTLYCVTTHVSRSGMQRSIMVIRATESKKPECRNISWRVAKALGWRFDEARDSVKVDGCGMDLHFHTVYCLGRTLFPDGGSLGLSAPSRIAQERRAGATKERDGGYLLRHASL